MYYGKYLVFELGDKGNRVREGIVELGLAWESGVSSLLELGLPFLGTIGDESISDRKSEGTSSFAFEWSGSSLSISKRSGASLSAIFIAAMLSLSCFQTGLL